MNLAVFWDFDGTLTYAPKLWTIAMRDALGEIMPAHPVTVDQLTAVRRTLRPAFPWSVPEQDNRPHTGPAFWAYMEAYFSDVFSAFAPAPSAKAAAALVRTKLLDPARYCLYPDALRALAACHSKGARNYIASNNYPELAVVAEKLGLAPFLDGVIVSGAIGYDKPRPEFFEYARRLAGEPARAFMVGDNPEADILGGHLAGMTTVLVHRNSPCCADFVLDALLPVASLL